MADAVLRVDSTMHPVLSIVKSAAFGTLRSILSVNTAHQLTARTATDAGAVTLAAGTATLATTGTATDATGTATDAGAVTLAAGTATLAATGTATDEAGTETDAAGT